MSQPTKILILGGGFGGMYTALELEKAFRKDPDVEITLVNRENFFLFTPMLHKDWVQFMPLRSPKIHAAAREAEGHPAPNVLPAALAPPIHYIIVQYFSASFAAPQTSKSPKGRSAPRHA